MKPLKNRLLAVGRLGIEPRTYGLKDRCSVVQNTTNSSVDAGPRTVSRTVCTRFQKSANRASGQGNTPYRRLPEPPPDPRATWWEIALATALAAVGLVAAVWSASGGLP